MSYRISTETLDWLNVYRQQNPAALRWEPIFMLPPWLSCWHRNFAPRQEPVILAVRHGETIAGVIPLLISDGTARLIGSPDVCDYLNIITAPGKEHYVSAAFLDWLKNNKIRAFEPGVVQPDSIIATDLCPIAVAAGCQVIDEPDEVTLETDLPTTWDEYLQLLDPKQRHEVKRKARRLEEVGQFTYRVVADAADVPVFMDSFLKMFAESRENKARFLTKQMEAYFRDLAETMAQEKLLRGGVLEIDGKAVASVFAFEYLCVTYLYNSGFDPSQKQFSVGILSKAFLIKDSIERGMKKFDFLKGGERYKYHLGGKEVLLRKISIGLEKI
jgi:CelD/BcsL family acetyltransferase involved in cellulose biosynthesis